MRQGHPVFRLIRLLLRNRALPVLPARAFAAVPLSFAPPPCATNESGRHILYRRSPLRGSPKIDLGFQVSARVGVAQRFLETDAIVLVKPVQRLIERLHAGLGTFFHGFADLVDLALEEIG